MTVKELRKFLDECSASDRDDSVFDNLPVRVIDGRGRIGCLGLMLSGFRIRDGNDDRELHLIWMASDNKPVQKWAYEGIET